MAMTEEPGKPRNTQERVGILMDRVHDKLFHNYVWQSIFRSGYPNTPRNQMLVVATNVFLHLHPTRIHRTHVKITHTYCLGGLTFFLFLGLTVTGVLLMFYYVPSVERAYQDIAALETNVRFGLLMRNMHRWMAHGMVILVFLHMMRVFYTGAYKPPREFNWVVGVILLVLTLLLCFTGYLLPWDQLALWADHRRHEHGRLGARTSATRRSSSSVGGFEVGPNALIRFYTLHVIAPAAARRDLHGRPLLAHPPRRRHGEAALGGAPPMAIEAPAAPGRAPGEARPRPKREREEELLVWPDLVFVEFICGRPLHDHLPRSSRCSSTRRC